MSLVNQSLTINFTIPKTEAKLIIFFVFNQRRNLEFSLHFTYCVNLCKTLTSNQSFYPDFTGVKLVACQQCEKGIEQADPALPHSHISFKGKSYKAI